MPARAARRLIGDVGIAILRERIDLRLHPLARLELLLHEGLPLAGRHRPELVRELGLGDVVERGQPVGDRVDEIGAARIQAPAELREESQA
jgi:hypothetical protein